MQTLQWLFQRSKPLITLRLSISGVWDYIFFPLSISYFPDKASEGKAFQYFRVNSTCQTPPRTRWRAPQFAFLPSPPLSAAAVFSWGERFPIILPRTKLICDKLTRWLRRRKESPCRRVLCAARWVEWPAALRYWRHVQGIAQGCQNKIHSGTNI